MTDATDPVAGKYYFRFLLVPTVSAQSNPEF